MSDSKNATDVDDIIERIAANDPSLTLTSIYLNENESIDAAACVRIAEALRGNTHLTLLLLRFNDIGDVGASALAETLKCNTTLAHLDLRHNDIGSVGALELSEMLKSNTTLTYLSLEGNGIGNDGTSALAEALKSNTTLTVLSLNNNGIGNDGASVLAEMLKSNVSLIKLSLSYNDIGDDGASALVEALQSNATLTQLYSYNNGMIIKRKIDRLLQINCVAKSEEEARRRKTTLRIEWMLDAEDEDEGGVQCEAAVALALDEMRSFPEAAHRRELLHTLLSSSQGRALYRCASKYSANQGREDVAASVETVPQGRALYRYAAECGANPAILVNILRAHPSLCSTCRDIKNKLYPFMLLATLPEARTEEVMEFLLQYPSLVVSGISESIGRGKRKRVDEASAIVDGCTTQIM
eukprot:CAMPEP_0113575360 /NCGR_PEP_ID=MMETSP0015_2-20120614/27650_1 /TAXON_ID=2838 /ORGANISM="Odontella" /LENGTH=411 /DNA_ID=CAMNT_0000478581 /DNA_START=42 /DNA_END=1277 /DNA_ORIENTATION=- /assembly_acc=CAM_ASM_000160